MKKNKVSILGTGAWGTALANVIADSGNEVLMWGVDTNEVNDINKNKNTKYYGNTKINKNIKATINLHDALKGANFVVIAIPSKFLKKTLIDVSNNITGNPIFINATKGLDPETMDPWVSTMKKILKKSLGIVSLTGPSFAIDVINKKPTIVNIVTSDLKIYQKVKKIFNCKYFKVVNCRDEIGSEICGATKNLLAIGVGIAHENHNSINTVAALLTTGINEIKEIIKIKKGDESTVLNYCGIGDIFLTCTSEKSRNFSFGVELYNKGLKKAVSSNESTVEGYTVYEVVKSIIKNNYKKYPIMYSICEVLSGNLNPKLFVEYSMDLIGLKDGNK